MFLVCKYLSPRNEITLQQWPIQRWSGLLCLLLLAGATLSSLRIGVSRAYSEYALLSGSLSAAENAIRLNPADAQGHYARGMALANLSRFTEVSAPLERAVQLNPRDYFLWLKLGRAYDWQQQPVAARGALESAARLAPFYAPPHWELGNLLLREGAREAGFAELRRASASNATLLPAVIELAWAQYNGDSVAVLQALQPQTPEAQLSLARHFARRNQLQPALALLEAVASDAAEEQRRRMLIDLLDQRRYSEAYQVWLTRRATEPEERQAFAQQRVTLSNGGFEKPLVRDREIPFGWHWADEAEETVKLALDPHVTHTGAYSLQLLWAGNLNIAIPVISQLFVVEPQRRYQLQFAARTQEVVSGGMPLIAVADVQAGPGGGFLGVSETLPRNSGGWRTYTVEFTTNPQTTAVRLLLRRQCKTDLCPIYGQIWLDDFAVQQR